MKLAARFATALVCSALAAFPAHAQRDAADRAAERDLADLRAKIESLSRELGAKEASRREARDALRDSERAISDANRELRALEAASRSAQDASRQLSIRRRGLSEGLERQQAALGRMLAARYIAGPPQALRITLAGDDPNEVSRSLHYITHLSRAAAAMIEAFRRDSVELERLSRSAREKAAQIETIEADKRRERQKIVSESRVRRQLLKQLAGEIRISRRKMHVLRTDEAQLARLVEEIGRVLSAKPGAGYARKNARGPVGDNVPEALTDAGPFSLLRGRLRLPVRGELLSRFGSLTRSGGNASKGIFIRSREGESVRAIAAGRVVFADWMRGFGNLLILDHGEAYLSIYGNAEALLRQPGDAVAAGEPIATAGSTGGRRETGLYFELRHLGKPVDPLGWVNPK